MQTIQQVLTAYAELLKKDFPHYVSKHNTVSLTARHPSLFSGLYDTGCVVRCVSVQVNGHGVRGTLPKGIIQTPAQRDLSLERP